jgi:sec-independent protein translocase protein TatA
VFRQIGPTEIIVILVVVLLLFGGKKLPELARGSGRALRIFRSEIKGMEDDETPADPKPLETREAEQGSAAEAERRAENTD